MSLSWVNLNALAEVMNINSKTDYKYCVKIPLHVIYVVSKHFPKFPQHSKCIAIKVYSKYVLAPSASPQVYRQEIPINVKIFSKTWIMHNIGPHFQLLTV